MDFEQIKARYLAGETDLKAETKFLYDTQGINAVYDFARTLDEEIGAAPYNLVMLYAEKLEAQKNAIQVNQTEVQKTALAKAALEAEKAYKQAEQIRFAESLTTSKNAPMQDIVKPAPPALFPNMGIVENKKPISGGVYFESEDYLTKIAKAASENKKTILVVAAGLALIAYFYFKKK